MVVLATIFSQRLSGSPLCARLALRVGTAPTSGVHRLSCPGRIIIFLMRTAFTALLLLSAALCTRAETSVFLEELAWTDVRDATQSGRTTIIIPVGATEQ